jgi:hypothetical protein
MLSGSNIRSGPYSAMNGNCRYSRSSRNGLNFAFPGRGRRRTSSGRSQKTVIFYGLVGYQRNGVSDEFHHHFRSDDVTCLEHRVEAIYQMTAAELRNDFKRTFMHNWIDDRSFVIISY